MLNAIEIFTSAVCSTESVSAAVAETLSSRTHSVRTVSRSTHLATRQTPARKKAQFPTKRESSSTNSECSRGYARLYRECAETASWPAFMPSSGNSVEDSVPF